MTIILNGPVVKEVIKNVFEVFEVLKVLKVLKMFDVFEVFKVFILSELVAKRLIRSR